MRTTIAIHQDIAARVASHAENMGNRSISSMVEFMLRKASDFIDDKGYNEFIKIPNSKKKLDK